MTDQTAGAAAGGNSSVLKWVVAIVMGLLFAATIDQTVAAMDNQVSVLVPLITGLAFIAILAGSQLTGTGKETVDAALPRAALIGTLVVGTWWYTHVWDDALYYEVVINGLLAGVMYSLVALGFVLIFKASGIFNFAQGIMALFAALTRVGLLTGQVPFAHVIDSIFGLGAHHLYDPPTTEAGSPPFWFIAICIAATLAVMIVLARIVVGIVLKPLVGQEGIILFMATIGLGLVLEGGGDLMWGSNVKPLDVGLPENQPSPWIDELTGMFISQLEIAAAVVAVILVVALTLFSQYTKMGRALRAVADDHQAALSVGISLETIWWIVWSVAGLVALVAGMMWGAKSGIQFSLSLIALKALPVLMLGGFTSIPGAILGGLLIGMGEKLFEFYIGVEFLGGATENWFAYVIALIFLLFRPQGLFGDKIIERV